MRDYKNPSGSDGKDVWFVNDRRELGCERKTCPIEERNIWERQGSSNRMGRTCRAGLKGRTWTARKTGRMESAGRDVETENALRGRVRGRMDRETSGKRGGMTNLGRIVRSPTYRLPNAC